MVAGAIMTGVAFLIASRVDSFGPLFGAYVLLGVGIGASTLLPCSLVIANWFGARRGLAMGLTFAGTSLGGAAMTMVGNFAIARGGGWRAGYVALAIPMFVIVVPLIILVVRTRPPQAEGVSVAQASDALPGFELREAFRCRSFWMIAAAQFFFAAIAAGTGLHLITYLTEVGYTPSFAAGMMSLIYLFAACGKLGMGLLADRVSARIALTFNFLAACVGMILIFGAARTAVLIPFVLVFGLSLGAPLVLVPMLVAESLGLKRFGSIGGIAGVFNTIGAFVGPVGAGKIYDLSGSYAPAFEIFVVMCILGAAVTYSCRSFESEQARQPSAPLPATA
jgi:MFS family permease